MGLFGKKKTTEEIMTEGQALYQQGEYSRASLVLLKASGERNAEVDLLLARCYLGMYGKKGDNTSHKLAKQYLKFAANEGSEEAAGLLASEFGE